MTHVQDASALSMRISLAALTGAVIAAAAAAPAHAQSEAQQRKLAEAAAVVEHFSSDEGDSIPLELMQRARGIAVIPDMIRGGFVFGARRGRGVLTVRGPDGAWSNPAIVTLTGGSIGWQIGAESADVVLVFANDNAVKNIRRGKFTVGGDATAVAGPLGRRATMAVTFRAEVYGYIRSRGLFAGAAFEGTRLALDDAASRQLYAAGDDDLTLEAQSDRTPPAVRRFLLSLAESEIGASGTSADESSDTASGSDADESSSSGEARTFPLGGAP